MNVIVCIDDSFGMLFNNRRQSKDIELTNRIIEMSKLSRLWIGEFSRSLFETLEPHILFIDDGFLNKAEAGDFCFVENCNLAPYIDKIEKLIVFKWNREYPTDFSLDIDLADWKLVSTTDFKGNSHKEITMEVYKR